jgi:hypothetical protein
MCSRSPVASLPARSFLLVVLAALAGVVLAGGALAAGHGVAVDQPVQDGTMTLENNTIEVDVDADGDTHWTVTWRFTLPDNDSRDQFDALAAEFDGGGAAAELGTLDTFRNASRQIDADRSRSIRITNETWTSNRIGTGENATGRLSLSFTWENFARVDGDRLIVDDALVTGDGNTWFGGLTADQELIIRIPDGYGVFDANVDPQDGALRWNGPMDFDETTLRATFIGEGATPEPDPSDDSNPALWGALGVFVVVVAAVAVFLVNRRGGLFPGPAGSDDEPPAAGASATPGPADTAGAEPEPEPGRGRGSADSEDSAAEIDEELLSDEERVERLLEANGGRMKQAHIVEETDWSNAKVSQLLSSMEDEGRIDKLRIGRENLISFPDVDVTGIENGE